MCKSLGKTKNLPLKTFSLKSVAGLSIFAYLTLSVFLSAFSAAQTPASSPSQAQPEVSLPVKPVEIQWWTIVLGLIAIPTAGVTLATAIVNYRTARIKKDLEARLFSSENTFPNEKRNAIIVVGIGGSGKTTLINQLFNENNANPGIATDCYELFTIDEGAQKIKYNYYVADCSGQNMGTLVSGLMLEQKRLNSPMTYGAINSVIIVVDTAEAPGVLESLTPEQVAANFQSRVEQHLAEWSNTALDVVFGLTGSSGNGLKYICLFINKADLLQGSSEEIERMVTEAYRPLIDKISKISRGIAFKCLIGSIQKGTRLRDLHKDLRDYSLSGEAVVSNRKN
jgi:hypothetical protein